MTESTVSTGVLWCDVCGLVIENPSGNTACTDDDKHICEWCVRHHANTDPVRAAILAQTQSAKANSEAEVKAMDRQAAMQREGIALQCRCKNLEGHSYSDFAEEFDQLREDIQAFRAGAKDEGKLI